MSGVGKIALGSLLHVSKPVLDFLRAKHVALAFGWYVLNRQHGLKLSCGNYPNFSLLSCAHNTAWNDVQSTLSTSGSTRKVHISTQGQFMHVSFLESVHVLMLT